MANPNKDNAVKFLEYMMNEDCSFGKVSKELGTFSALLFFLRAFEKWCKDNDI